MTFKEQIAQLLQSRIKVILLVTVILIQITLTLATVILLIAALQATTLVAQTALPVVVPPIDN